MWWTQGVSSAIQASQLNTSPLIILVEPTSQILNPPSEPPESSQNKLSRLATSSLHSLTFSHPSILQLIQQSQSICLKFPADPLNSDFQAFSAYFKLVNAPPNLFFISPLSGQTLIHKQGFVSPKQFADALITTTKAVSGNHLPFPDTTTSTSEPPTLSIPQETPPFQPSPTNSPREPPAIPKKTPSLSALPKSNPSPSTPVHVPTKPSSKSLKLPPPSSTDVNQPSEARLLLRLPNGSQVRKTFAATVQFSLVRSWVEEQVDAQRGETVNILTVFPRRVFDLGCDSKMLMELNLCPTETLIVGVENGGGDIGRVEEGGVRVTGVRAYAWWAYQFVAGFVTSFVRTDGVIEAEGGTLNMGGGRTAGGVGVQGVRNETREGRRRRALDDDNLLSNGNSTQYGWNSDDEDEEAR